MPPGSKNIVFIYIFYFYFQLPQVLRQFLYIHTFGLHTSFTHFLKQTSFLCFSNNEDEVRLVRLAGYLDTSTEDEMSVDPAHL
jgi:hypothetical protein